MIKADDIFASLNTEKKSVRLIEGHWNQYGHKLIAEGIAKRLVQQEWK